MRLYSSCVASCEMDAKGNPWNKSDDQRHQSDDNIEFNVPMHSNTPPCSQYMFFLLLTSDQSLPEKEEKGNDDFMPVHAGSMPNNGKNKHAVVAFL